MTLPANIALRAQSISKAYGATVALASVDFDVRSSAVNVLIGENGAGKSTLMRIIAGVETADSGALLLDGEPVRFASVREAAANGIGIVFQELNLCPNLTVTENIFLDYHGGNGLVIDRADERAKAAALLKRLGADFSADEPVGCLRVGQQQIVEIARALSEEVRILILDEPTSALSAAEVDTLFKVIGELRGAGVAIIYISHRLEELLRIGDYVTVLRDGCLVESAPIANVSVPWIVERMLGKSPDVRPAASAVATGDVVLSVENPALSTSFREGEVTALYGLLGAGRTELLEAICGARAGAARVTLKGEAISKLPLPDRVARGLLLVPEDRQAQGLFQNLSVGGNLGMSFLQCLTRAGIIAAPAEATAISGMMRRLGIKAPSGDSPITALSGGNQQKVVIGRCLMPGPVVLLLDEPTRGVDIGARGEIFAVMRALAAEGLAILFATSDLTEARTAADRILVLASGRITADLPANEASEAALVQAANRTLEPA